MDGLLLLALLLLAIAIGLRWLARRWRSRIGLTLPGRILAVDHGEWRRPKEPLRADRFGLVGRPDFLVEYRGDIIPVEVKSAHPVRSPYAGDRLQLAAYCLLVEETFGRPPPFGLLCYGSRTFRVRYAEDLRIHLLRLLEEMRRAERLDDVPRSHEEPGRCAACSMRAHCGPYALAGN